MIGEAQTGNNVVKMGAGAMDVPGRAALREAEALEFGAAAAPAKPCQGHPQALCLEEHGPAALARAGLRKAAGSLLKALPLGQRQANSALASGAERGRRF